jgi:hypothetical protein
MKRATIRKLFVACFVLVPSLAYTCALKLEAVDSSETSVNIYRIMRPHTTEDSTFQGNDTLYQYLWGGGGTWNDFEINKLKLISYMNVTRVEAGSNTSTVTLRVVGGDEKESLESETVKYGRESYGTRTRK